MNRLEKVLSIFMILTMMTFWGSLSVFAETSGQSGPYFPNLDAPSSQPSVAPPSAPPPSSAPPASSPSKPSSSSRPVKRTANSSSAASSWDSSQTDSSDPFGGVTSDSWSSGVISLPSVDSVSENDPLQSVVTHTEASHRMNWIGLLAWACIALGVIVVLVVVFSNRRPPRGMGRKRYRRPKRSRKKKLLNDKYYRNINRY